MNGRRLLLGGGSQPRPIKRIANSTATATATGSVTVNKPTGTQNDDLLVAFIYSSVGVSNQQAVNLASGWEWGSGEQSNSSGSTGGMGILWRRAGASEPSTYTFTVNPTVSGSQEISATVVCLRNATYGWNPYGAVAVAATPVTARAFNINAAGGLVYCFAGVAATGSTLGTPTDFTSEVTTGTTDISTRLSYKEIAVAASEQAMPTAATTYTGGAVNALAQQCYIFPTDYDLLVPDPLSTTYSRDAVSDTSFTMTAPAGPIVDGDLLVFVFHMGGNAVVTQSEGITEATPSNSALYVGYKYASSESGNYDFTLGTSRAKAGWVLHFRGVAWGVVGTVDAVGGGGVMSIVFDADYAPSRAYIFTGISLTSIDIEDVTNGQLQTTLADASDISAAPSIWLYSYPCGSETNVQNPQVDPTGASGSGSSVAFTLKQA